MTLAGKCEASFAPGKYNRQHHAPFPAAIPSWHRKKPLWIVLRENEESHNSGDGNHTGRRHLTLLDLISVGVGGTIGSGIFVLAGFIAKNYAGPATTVSFVISGIAAAASGVCYAELSGKIPSSGSTYVYCYVCMGEAAAVIAAACLTLEYGVSGAAVARSWGDKMVAWLRDQWHWDEAENYLQPHGINLVAGLVSSVSVALLLGGINESKQVMNFFTATKILLVVFMTTGGFVIFQASNLHSDTRAFAPYGASGILRGATSSFFGYLGYDEVCCMAGEALHPRRDMPRAVLWTLLIVTVLYIFASLSLSGMIPYEDISETSGFPAAFDRRGVSWAANVSAFGEVFTLPVVVLISLMAQPRLQQAMAQDGLLPQIFARVDQTGNLKWGIFLSGVAMVVVATFVPFTYLDDLISAGILLAFSMTNSCLILLRCESPVEQPSLAQQHLVALNFLCLAAGLLFSHGWGMVLGPFLAGLSLLGIVVVVASLARQCPEGTNFGGSVASLTDNNPQIHVGGEASEFFRTPLVPFLPSAGILVNWFLIGNLELSGLLFLLCYVVAAVGTYLCYISANSINSAIIGWKWPSYTPFSALDGDLQEWTMLQRELSMPPIPPVHQDSPVTSRKTVKVGAVS